MNSNTTSSKVLVVDDVQTNLTVFAKVVAQLPPSLYLGTSTWTYPGWTGLIYERPYPKTGATVRMLAEYARYPLFRTVGVDSFFYRPPTPERRLRARAAKRRDRDRDTEEKNAAG